MLFLLTWSFVDNSEEGIKRSLAVFGNWQPPAGLQFHGFYGFADGSGGCAIVETDSAATLARGTAPFTPWIAFETTPILPVEESAAIGAEGLAFRDSIS